MGGKSFEPYSLDWTNTLKKEIRQRDNYTCQLCGCRQEDTTHLVHHIDYNKKNCNPDNLITLCRSCHTTYDGKVKYLRNNPKPRKDAIKSRECLSCKKQFKRYAGHLTQKYCSRNCYFTYRYS